MSRVSSTSISLRKRIALVFGSVAALLLCFLGLVWVLTHRIHAELGRVLEEQRESRQVLRLEHALQDLGRLARDPAGNDSAETTTALGRAQELVESIWAQAPIDDPSNPQHQSEENALLSSLRSRLAALAGGPAAADAGAIEDLTQAIQQLGRETEDESQDAALDLELEAGRTRRIVLAATLVSLAVLGWVLYVLSVHVLQPILLLRREARTLARGHGVPRLTPRTLDEIGELTEEFNAMASEVSRARSDLEQRVVERTRQLVRAGRLADLGTLAAGIAHEINNPLASIASSAEGLERRLIAGSMSTDDQREYLHVIAKEAYRAHGIASRLLEFASPHTGARSLFDLASLLRELQLLLHHRLRQLNLELSIDCPPACTQVLGQAAETKQVLLNLLQNAIDASPHGGRIDVVCAASDGLLSIEVRDQGSGIAESDLERIFDPFFTTKPPGQGTGLGLAIAQRIVIDQGGTLEARSGPQGTTLRLRLPLSTEESP